jgi:hypothetical protein
MKPLLKIARILLSILAVAGITAVGVPGAQGAGVAKSDAGAFLDSWHEAAARADEKAYFDGFAPDGVFLGTDPTERWTVVEFRKWAHPRFAKGKAWTMKSRSRHLSFSKDGATAWFDEELDSTGMGAVRGSGVLVRLKGQWKVAQYNLSIPILNDRFKEVRALLDSKPAPSPSP